MRYLHRASIDDSPQTGLTLLRAWIGGYKDIVDLPCSQPNEIAMAVTQVGGVERTVGLRLLIDIPSPFKREFQFDYDRYRAVRRVHWWLCIDACRFGFSEIRFGSRPGPR